MKNNKKKLPRYWIGTRMPIDSGRQKAAGIGNAMFTTDPGKDLTGTAKAAHQGILPGFIANAGQNLQHPMLMLLNIKTIPITTQLTAPLANAAAANFGQSVLQSGGSGVKSLSNVIGRINNLGTNNVLTGGSSTVAKTKLSGLGIGAGIAGTALGLVRTFNDFTNSGPTLSLSDIANSSSINKYTTEYGNTYTQHGGVDRSSILSYADAEKKSKQIGLTTDLAGTFMSAGGRLGSAVPIIGPIFGSVAGGLLGAAAGGIASLLGFGDNEDEYKERIRHQQDVFAMQDRLSESLAKDADTKAAFAQNKPLGAANGKLPGYKNGINARVSNGEGIAKYANGLIYDLKRVPGLKNNDDTVETHLDKNDIVFSNKFGISDEAMVDPYSALARQTILLNMGILGKSKNAKNGKLPSFWGGTAGLYLNVAVPSIYGIAANLARLNEVNSADRTIPRANIQDFGANDAINETYADQKSPREYIKQAHDLYRLQIFENRRTAAVNAGRGATSVYNLAAYNQMQRQLADTRLKIDEANRTQRNSSRSMRLQDALNRRAFDLDNFWKSDQRAALINKAYEGFRSTIPLNMYNIAGATASNIGQIGNYNDALGLNREHLALFKLGVKNDTDKVNAIINNMRNSNYTPVIQDNKETDPVQWYNSLPWWQQNYYLGKSARNAANLIISV